MSISHFRRPQVALSGVVACILVLLCSIGGAASDLAQPELSDLVVQFQRVSSLHLSASVKIKASSALQDCCPQPDPDPKADSDPIPGRFEYWATGDRYRISSYVDSQRYPEMQTQVAFDGQMFQLLRSDGTLSHSADDTSALLPVLPNPLLELLQFCYPLSDATAQFDIRLKDVQSDGAAQRFDSVQWSMVREGDRSLERAILPGATYEERAYLHYVYVAPGSRHMPLRIDRVTDTGRITSTEFFDYERVQGQGGPTFWPRRIVLRAYDSQGREAGNISFSIDHIAVDAEIRDGAFSIDPHTAQRIWDDSRQGFVGPSDFGASGK